MDFYGNVDLLQNQMQQMVIQQETNFPVVPKIGRVVFKDKRLYMCVAIESDVPVWIPLTNKIDTFIHTQSVSSTSWTITHNLNTTIAMVQVYDTNGEMLIPDSVSPNGNNEMVVTFSTALIGTAVVLYGELRSDAGVLLATAVDWDLTNITYDSLTFDSAAAFATGINLNADGTKIYVTSAQAADRIYQFTLSAPYDLTSPRTFDGLLSIETNSTSPFGTTFNDDGTKMFIVDNSTADVLVYNLSVPYDFVNSAVYNTAFSVLSEEQFPTDVAFNTDGTRMIVMGTDTFSLHQYTLGTPYDVSTASYDSISFALPVSAPFGMYFNPTGTNVIFAHSSKLVKYTLDAFDITTLVLAHDVATPGVVVTERSVVFKPDGTKMFMLDSQGNVYQYSTNI